MKAVLKELLITLVYIVVGALMALFITNFLVQKVTVDGTSMVDTLSHGNHLFGVRKGMLYSEPERYDIVVLDMGSEECYVKRIIGMPGDTVQIMDEQIYINDSLLGETYGYGDMGYVGIAKDPITLGEGEYFVLGDNRSMSKDSRDPEVGIIYEDQILSKLGLRIWPLKEFGVVK